MAVYEGARPRAGLGIVRPAAPGVVRRERPTVRVDGPALPRRRARITIRAGRRPSRVGLVLGAILVVFLLGFLSLAQTVRVSASGYDVDQLQADRTNLQAAARQLRSDLNRLGGEPAIRKLAIDGGLAQLPEPIVIPAR